MIRLHMVVEGQTEEAYANRVIVPHLAGFDVFASVQLTARGRGTISRARKGGWTSYESLKSQILRWHRSDQAENVYFTTMLDLYALPTDFPGYYTSTYNSDAYSRVDFLEQALLDDIRAGGLHRLVPYLQLHEFEALLLADPEILRSEFLEHSQAIDRLSQMVRGYDSPELINLNPTTAPSKRIIAQLPEYEARKVSAGPVVADKIGLATLRRKCRHFSGWLDRLESLSR